MNGINASVLINFSFPHYSHSIWHESAPAISGISEAEGRERERDPQSHVLMLLEWRWSYCVKFLHLSSICLLVSCIKCAFTSGERDPVWFVKIAFPKTDKNGVIKSCHFCCEREAWTGGRVKETKLYSLLWWLIKPPDELREDEEARQTSKALASDQWSTAMAGKQWYEVFVKHRT